MKTSIALLFCLGIVLQAKGQNKSVDTDKPISSIDVSYAVGNNLIITLLLNAKENTQSVSGATSAGFKATVEGQIVWAVESTDAKESLVSGTFLASSSETPFKYSADLKNGLGAFIPSPAKRNWIAIENVKIKYEIDGKYNEVPTMTIYPPTTKTQPDDKTVKVSSRGKMLDKRKVEINLESEPSGTAFEVTEIEFRKTNGGNESIGKYSAAAIGNARFANNGKIALPFATTFDVNEGTASFQAKVTVRIVNTKELVTSALTDVVLTDDIPLIVLNRPADHSLTIDDNKDLVDSGIITEGKGELGLRFATKEYADKIRIKKSQVGNVYTLTLEGVNQVPDRSFSYFYYTRNNNEIISPPHLITKAAPVLTNFQFDGTDNNNIYVGFNLPKFVDDNRIRINIIGRDGKEISLNGSMVVNRDASDNTRFNIKLPLSVTNLIANDTVNQFGFIVSYDATRLYSLNVKMFNQRLLNEKIADLISIASERPARRKREEIKSIVQSIVEIGKSVGNSIADAEVIEAIDNLERGNRDEIKNTMMDIGRWALMAGKIVLPVL